MTNPIQRSASIEIVTAPMVAGESKLFFLGGEYFELIDVPGGTVDVLLSDEFGAQRGLMRNAEASFYIKATPFKVVQITSPTTQVIRFGYGSGEGGTRRAAGSVSIANTPTVALQAADAALIRRPEQPGAHWNSSATLVANSPLTVFAPGANVNGAIVWHAESWDSAPGGYSQVFIAKNAAPASVVDGEIIAQALYRVASTQNVFEIKVDTPRRIAPGLGLYFISSAAGSAGVLRNCRYTLL